MNIALMALVGVPLVALLFVGVNIYNGLISLRNQLERAWGNIDVILKQRFDEIPKLIQVIEQHAGYEAGLLKTLAEARAHYMSSKTRNEKIRASQEANQALRGLVAIGEAYPALKASDSFLQLQSRVSQLESTIADRRESYNEMVANFNTRIGQFPDVLVANLLRFERQDMYPISVTDKVDPSLKMKLPKFG